MKNARSICALTVAALAGLASADVTNPGFETLPAFSGWTTTGSITISTAAPAAPTEGTSCALLNATNTSAPALTAFLGCTAAQLQTQAQTTTAVVNGSAVKQTFTIAENETLSFDFAFNNLEAENDQEWPDTCFVVVNGEPFALASSGSLPRGWTPVQQFTKGDIPVGPVTIAFTVINFGDPAVNSQFMVDNIRIQSTTASACGPADLGVTGGAPGFDNHLNNNDFVAFIDLFFANDPRADLGSQGGIPGPDAHYDNNDFVTFIDAFFAGC